jgi:hypothetical protein
VSGLFGFVKENHMKTTFPVLCAVLLVSSLLSSGAEPGGKISTRAISVVEQRAKDLSGENLDFPCMAGLKVTVEISGPAVKKATHWGKLTVTKGADDKGGAIAVDREPSEDLQEILRVPRFSFGDQPASKEPEDKVRIELGFKETPRTATAVKVLEGSFVVRVAEKKEIVVPDIAKLAGKVIDDKTLKAAGLSLEVNEFSPEGTYLKLAAVDPEDKIGEMDIVDAKGKSYVNSRGSMRAGDKDAKKEFSLGGEDKLPDDVRLKITVTTSKSDIKVPFSFKDLPLP